MTEEATNSIENLSFEQALAELETIVRNLEQGNVPLEKSIELYSRGEALREKCDSLLKAAEEKVEKIQMNSAGAATGTEPLGD